MSFISDLLTAIENDAVAAEKWVVSEVETLATEAVTAILLPFFQEIEPQLVADLETVLEAVAKDAGMAAVDYLTGAPVGKVFTDIASKAAAEGMIILSQLEPEAMTVLVSLKTLALKGIADVETAVAKVI